MMQHDAAQPGRTEKIRNRAVGVGDGGGGGGDDDDDDEEEETIMVIMIVINYE